MMSKKNVTQLLENTREQYKGKNIVAFIGESHCGKTVVSALLKFTIVNYFVPKSNGQYEAEVTKGGVIIDNIIKKMHSPGFFPPHTLRYSKSPLVIDIHTSEGFGGKIEMILRDMSGEDYEEYLNAEYDDHDDRLNDLLVEGKKDSDTIGPISHIVFAKMYVMLIDCSKYKTWITDQSDYARTISNLKKLKEKIGEVIDGKFFTTPIAILFTKSDQLPEDKQKISPSELIKEMPELISSLHINHKGPIEYFSMHVQTDNATPEEILKMQEEEPGEKALTEQMIQERMTGVFNNAKTKALQAGMDEQQANIQAENTKKAELKKIDDMKKQLANQPQQRFKLKNPPILYSHSEYIRFISWMVERLLGK